MNTSPDLLGAGPALGLGLDLLAKSGLLIVAALAARRCFGRGPLVASALGHACLLGLLVLPLSGRFGPTLLVRLPAAEMPIATAGRAAKPAPEAVPQLAQFDPFEALVDRAPAPADPALPRVAVASGPQKVPAPALPPPSVAPEPPKPTDWSALAVGAYLVVASALLARLAISLAAVARLSRSSVAVDDPAWLEPLGRIKLRLGIDREVGLAWSSRVGVPVVVGWSRPTILLPAEGAEGVASGHVEPILLHELAHVRRGDYAWNILARVIEALYWPQPLAWLLGRAVAESRELACDAFCVGKLGGPSTYREALIAMAEGLIHRPGPALGLAIAGRSRLARRVAQIDRNRGSSRCLSAWPTRVVVLALALLSAVGLGPARVTRAEPGPASRPAAGPMPTAPAPAQAPAAAPGGGRTLRLRVVAAGSGKPVPRAVIRVWMAFRDDDWRTTDDEGRIDIVHSTGPADRTVGVDAWGEGFAQQRQNWGRDFNVPVPDEATVRLQAGESLGGVVQDEAGRPVEGAIVYLWAHNYKRKDPGELLYDLRSVTGPDGRWHTGGAPETTGEILGIYITHPDFLSDRRYNAERVKPPIADLRAGRATSTLKKGTPIDGRVLDAEGRPVAGALVISTDYPGNLFGDLEKFAVRSDTEGRFRTGQVKAGDWHLIAKAAGHGPGVADFPVAGAIPFVEVRLPRPIRLDARVVDPDGNPIEGAFVNVDTWRGFRCLGAYLYSDADGRVRWDDAPADSMAFNVDRAGYRGLFMHRASAGDGPVTFTLSPSLTISGIVRDSETRKGVEAAFVEYGAVDPASGEVAAWEKFPETGWTTFSQGHLNANLPVSAEAYKIRIAAEGYRPFVSRAFARGEKVVTHYDVSLVPGSPDGPRVTALRPDGRPLVGASIYRIRDENTGITPEPAKGARAFTTGPDGTFAIPLGDATDVVLIRGEESYAFATIKELAGSPNLATRPYGRIEGRFLVGDRPSPRRPIRLEGQIRFAPNRWTHSFGEEATTTTDADGRFAFEKVIPTPDLRVGLDWRGTPGLWSLGMPVRVEDGKTTTFQLGGTGRAVVGRVEPPQGWDRSIDFTANSTVAIETEQTTHPAPLEIFRGKNSIDESGWSEWMNDHPSTPDDFAYANARVAMSIGLAADGSFRFDDVPPGSYRASIRVNRERFGRGEPPEFAVIARTLVVPDGPAGAPIVLENLRLQPRVALKAGDPAPRFEVVTTEGKTLKVPDDYKGKFLLLDFGSLWDGHSRLQIARMNGTFARFAKDERFALLSLLLAVDRPDARRFVADKAQPWPQAIVGPLSNPIASSYGVGDDEMPATVLIGPDGRVIASDVLNFNNAEVIARAMGLPERTSPAPRARPKE